MFCYFRLSVVAKPGVPPFGPYLHSPPVFRKDAYFRHFLLTKRTSQWIIQWEVLIFFLVVNACHATFEAPAFEKRLSRANIELLKIFIDEIQWHLIGYSIFFSWTQWRRSASIWIIVWLWHCLLFNRSLTRTDRRFQKLLLFCCFVFCVLWYVECGMLRC